MHVLILSPGKAHAPELRDAISMYETRLRGNMKIVWEFPTTTDVETEGKAILRHLKPEDLIVLLDERGTAIDSPGLAEILDTALQSGTKRLVFVIGGAYGVSAAVAERADQTIALSKLVFPHMLVRLILLEQLYRAWSIRSGGKYHHA